MGKSKNEIINKINVVRRNLAFAEQHINNNWDDMYKLNITEKSRISKKIDKLARDSGELDRLAG